METVFLQNFYTRKLDEMSVFYAVKKTKRLTFSLLLHATVNIFILP